MSFEPVDIHFMDANGYPVESALVKVYSLDGSQFYTQAVSDPAGKASLLLETLSYSLRFYKTHASFKQPQRIDVVAGANQFNVPAEVHVMPIATDPRLCRASGFFRDIDGSPRANLDIHIISKFQPLVLEGDAVVSERIKIRTDSDGFVCVDLIRCGQYLATLEAWEGEERLLSVPDALSVNLPDLLFPVVESVTFDPSGPYDIKVGESLVITPAVLTSDDRPLDGTSTSNVNWGMTDPNVASVTVAAGTLTLVGKGAGTTSLIAERSDLSVTSIPDSGIAGQPMQVNVTL